MSIRLIFQYRYSNCKIQILSVLVEMKDQRSIGRLLSPVERRDLNNGILKTYY